MREKYKIQFMLHLLSGQCSETMKYGPILLNLLMICVPVRWGGM